MIHAPGEQDPLELLVDEFVARCRRGERPSVAEYAAKYPHYAERIEQVFPAVGMMEQLRVEEAAERKAAMRREGYANLPEHLGDFEIVQEIGRGGMGIVYEAEQRSLARRVALKLLPCHALLAENDLKRFQREAQTAAGLHHTNIVGVFGVGEQDGLHYYVMPLVRGVGVDEVIAELRRAADHSTADSPQQDRRGDPAPEFHRILRELIARKFPPVGDDGRQTWQDTANSCSWCRRPVMPFWQTVARIGIQAADALAHAHAQGTLHRDIKPSNLLVDEHEVVWVADFGLARAIDPAEVSPSREVVGTLRYMAPEQFQGRADARSDLYALGLTLYELLCLRPAFPDPGGGRTRSEPVRPRRIDPGIPRDLETIVLKCLADDPVRRYATASALAADLRAVLEDRPIQARRASWVERAGRWCLRNPALAGVSALAAVLLVAVALTAFAGYVGTRRAYREATLALGRAEATSQLSLEVLEDIYLQLSPDRAWISSAADPSDAACACIGLRSGETPESVARHIAMQVQASPETASLLEHLLVFYDRLAEQAGDDPRVLLQSAIASRRVGDIRQRLGQIDRAEREYARALQKLSVLRKSRGSDAKVLAELARSHNEIGNIQSARLDDQAAFESHQQAQLALVAFGQTGSLPADCRYELARTLYLLSSKRRAAADHRNRSRIGEGEHWPRHDQANEDRKSAIRILEELARENPDIPDYQFLLALCHRPPGMVPAPARGPAGEQGLRRAIRILEQLKTQYPGVADYRYELTATYAWVPVALFPWQGRSAAAASVEQSLLKALDESQWLVTHNPTIPHYVSSHALILAKLGTVCWHSRRLAEAEDYLEKALAGQSAVAAKHPDMPAHQRVLVEFLRLRLGQICYERSTQEGDAERLRQACDLLETCAENLAMLTAEPELSEDRLAWSSLPAAREALSLALAASEERKKLSSRRFTAGEDAGRGSPGTPR